MVNYIEGIYYENFGEALYSIFEEKMFSYELVNTENFHELLFSVIPNTNKTEIKFTEFSRRSFRKLYLICRKDFFFNNNSNTFNNVILSLTLNTPEHEAKIEFSDQETQEFVALSDRN